jgi:hypothetical protein
MTWYCSIISKYLENQLLACTHRLFKKNDTKDPKKK